MDKILSINTIKNVFSALGAKTSDDNYGVALLDKTTAEPKGLMGMSVLASVLGDNYFFQPDSTISDCNNAPLGLSLTDLNTQNTPASAQMLLITYDVNGNRAQLCLRATGILYYRGYAGNWYSWKQVQMTDV